MRLKYEKKTNNPVASHVPQTGYTLEYMAVNHHYTPFEDGLLHRIEKGKKIDFIDTSEIRAKRPEEIARYGRLNKTKSIKLDFIEDVKHIAFRKRWKKQMKERKRILKMESKRKNEIIPDNIINKSIALAENQIRLKHPDWFPDNYKNDY